MSLASLLALHTHEQVQRFLMVTLDAGVQDKITKITIDELLASDPNAAKAIDEDIRKGDFLP